MIKVENLSKFYGDVKAVNSINFELNFGEIVGFLGANGAGKSTTLKVMTGYLTATAGSVYVNDLDIQENTLEIQKMIEDPMAEEIITGRFANGCRVRVSKKGDTLNFVQAGEGESVDEEKEVVDQDKT